VVGDAGLGVVPSPGLGSDAVSDGSAGGRVCPVLVEGGVSLGTTVASALEVAGFCDAVGAIASPHAARSTATRSAEARRVAPTVVPEPFGFVCTPPFSRG
jgi:hypothetical protein